MNNVYMKGIKSKERLLLMYTEVKFVKKSILVIIS